MYVKEVPSNTALLHSLVRRCQQPCVAQGPHSIDIALQSLAWKRRYVREVANHAAVQEFEGCQKAYAKHRDSS